MKKILLPVLILFCTFSYSQELITGNVIPDYGKTYPVDSPDFQTDTTSILKAVIDIDRSFKDDKPNNLIETAARFLNMHENAGVKPGNMEVALVLHGKAVQDVLEDKFYSEIFPGQSTNPNLPLIKALSNQGVKIILCGQSATHYGVTKVKADHHVSFALSAMTALVQLQKDNYQLIKF